MTVEGFEKVRPDRLYGWDETASFCDVSFAVGAFRVEEG